MRWKLALTLALALGLTLTLFVAFAQGPVREEGEEEQGDQAQDIGGLGLADPPPPGFSVLYMFTGVANDNDGTDQVATAVHCTNFGSTSISVTLQLFASGGSTVANFADTLSSNETTTYSSQNTFFTEVPLSPGIIEQGSGRILATANTVICTAQLLQPGAITPTFMVKLPLFDEAGNLIGTVSKIYLPVILKQ